MSIYEKYNDYAVSQLNKQQVEGTDILPKPKERKQEKRIVKRKRNRTMSRAEKFIEDCTRNCSNEIEWNEGGLTCHDYVPWLTPDQARKAVEIEREEILNKVYKYIKDNLYKNLYVYNGEAGFPTFQFIEDIKQAMKDE